MSEWMDADSRVERAHDLYCKGRWVEAAAELRAAISSNPYNPSWHFNLGLTLEALDDFKGAIRAFSENVRLDPNDIEGLCRLGVNLGRLGKFDLALKTFQRVQKLDPNYEPGYCNRIIIYTEMGQHEDAEVMFYMAQQLNDACPLCYFNIGNSLYARKRYEAAIDCWMKCLELDPTQPQAHSRIGDAYWAMGRLDLALNEFQMELDICESDDIDALLDMGELLTEMNRTDEAEHYFLTVLKKEPENADAHFFLGEIAEKRGDADAAAYRYRKTLKKDSKFKGANLRLGRLAMHTDQRRTALTHLKAELDLNDDNPQLLQEIGELLIEGKMVELAYHAFARLAALLPNDANALHNLAVCCFMLNRMEEGIVHCRKSIRICGWYILAIYNLALAYKCLGRNKRALALTIKAFRLSPKDPNVIMLRKRMGFGGWFGYLKLALIAAKHGR
ncbi:MAG TPA: tetratricopeptide repeat protein [Phycisphaerae bacterium]|nr:tetratricopeptide repeat protein [Phycisphaerae bacterium]HPS53198.1 tetratricopeptide repeat protein [Phycisphaerae bacterium]